ncbi:hypothetical protein [Flexithrix dorotheae]|uniref:hypothetical protein n=1 Tax=Flexithrix dorotheae TaxID=70993 RepID=UPI000382A58B|nr:hypothetical protein [Flexithrix dorotheae]
MKKYSLILFITFLIPILFSCENIISLEKPEEDSLNKSAKIKLIEVDVPDYVFSLANEVISFKTSSEELKEGEKEEVSVDISSLRKKIKMDFDSVMVVEENMKGEFTTLIYKVGAENFFEAKIIHGNIYHIYASLGSLYYNSYTTISDLSAIFEDLKPRVLNQICFLILCTNDFFYASELFSRIPELEKYQERFNFRGRVIGNLPVSNPCRDCFSNPRVIPRLPYAPGSGTPGGGSGTDIIDLVMQYNPFPGDSLDQIYKINATAGGRLINLSNSRFNDREPDVSDDGSLIVYSTEQVKDTIPGRFGSMKIVPGLAIMEVDGTNQFEIPGVFGNEPKFVSIDEGGIATLVYKRFEFGDITSSFYGNIYKLELDIPSRTVLSNTLIRQGGSHVESDYISFDATNEGVLVYNSLINLESQFYKTASLDILSPSSTIDEFNVTSSPVFGNKYGKPTISIDGTRLMTNFYESSSIKSIEINELHSDGTFGINLFSHNVSDLVSHATSFGNTDFNSDNLLVLFSANGVIYKMNTDGSDIISLTSTRAFADYPNFIP